MASRAIKNNIKRMTAKEFEKLSLDLRKLAKTIPLNLGQVQNNRSDDKIKMFSIDSYEDLEEQIGHLSEPEKNYLRRRWYLWRCSQCDEYLFYSNDNVEQNPDRYDKAWIMMSKVEVGDLIFRIGCLLFIIHMLIPVENFI